jgi:hypothetical protein
MDYSQIARLISRGVFTKIDPMNRWDDWDLRRIGDMVITNHATYPGGKVIQLVCDKTALTITSPGSDLRSNIEIITDSIVKINKEKTLESVYFAIGCTVISESPSEKLASLLFVYGLEHSEPCCNTFCKQRPICNCPLGQKFKALNTERYCPYCGNHFYRGNNGSP